MICSLVQPITNRRCSGTFSNCRAILASAYAFRLLRPASWATFRKISGHSSCNSRNPLATLKKLSPRKLAMNSTFSSNIDGFFAITNSDYTCHPIESANLPLNNNILTLFSRTEKQRSQNTLRPMPKPRMSTARLAA
ncbi:protein of unknown function [Nitratireductor aquimarinus]